jgi:hypothetical protein
MLLTSSGGTISTWQNIKRSTPVANKYQRRHWFRLTKPRNQLLAKRARLPLPERVNGTSAEGAPPAPCQGPMRRRSDPALLAQAQVIAQNEMVLRAIREQQIAVVDRLRDPTAIALTKRDNSLELTKTRSQQARHADKEITQRLPGVLEKYRDRLEPRDFDPNDCPYDLVPLRLKVLLEEPDSEEEQRALDLARKQIEQQQRDEHEALQEAIPDLIRLERYEHRAWSRQQRAIREFLNIKFTPNLPEMPQKQSSR